MQSEALLKILFTGDYLPDYNRTLIIRNGLRTLGHEVIDFPFKKKTRDVARRVREFADQCDFIFMPSFTHQQVVFTRKAIGPEKVLIFDPLISRYLTKVYDYKLVSPFGLSALRNYFRDKWPMEAATFVVTDTQAHLHYFAERFHIPKEKMAPLYIGNDFSQFHPRGTDGPTNADDFHVGFYGGFIPLQGVMQILEAAKILQSTPGIRFTLVGNGFEYDKAMAFIKQENLENVHLPGWFTPDELLKAIQSFDLALGIFGRTHKSDLVIPNKVYHYAACAKPILSKDSPAVRELFEDAETILLCSTEPKDIATAILRLRDDPGLRLRLGNGAFAMLKENYNEAAVARRLVTIAKDHLEKSCR